MRTRKGSSSRKFDEALVQLDREKFRSMLNKGQAIMYFWKGVGNPTLKGYIERVNLPWSPRLVRLVILSP